MSVENNIEQKESKDEQPVVHKKFYSPTIRLTLTLREPDEESCSVFNYNSLVAEEKRNRRREKEKCQVNGTVEEPEDDTDVKRLAQHFEEKYGGVNPKKKRKKRAPKFYNYTDLASGYDESDSFIDNSEAFDEALPDEMETILGGYYVNTGQLEFKKVEFADDNSDLDEIRVGKRKTCFLKSDDDSSSDGENAKSDVDDSKTDEEDGETVTKKLPEETNHEDVEPTESTKVGVEVTKPVLSKEKSNHTVKINGELVKKKKKYKKRRVQSDESQDDIPKHKKKTVTVKSLLEEKRIVENGDSTANVSCKAVENDFSSINDVIESVVNAARNHSEDSRDSTSSSLDTKSIDSRSSYETEKESHAEDVTTTESSKAVTSKEQVKLPDNLSAEVLEMVNQIKNSAYNSEPGGTRTFFKSSVNLKLLNLESQVRSLKSAARHSLYEYLASFLPCSKDTLMKRAKKLLIEEEERHVVEPFQKLKASIDKIMPSLMDNYTAACQQIAEEKNVGDLKNGEIDEKKSLASKMPPMKFIWTDETRSYLRELISCRLKCFHTLKPRKESAEDYVKKFLETKVKPLWPPGWMETSVLLKESQLSSLMPKVKKLSLPSGTIASTTITAITSTTAAAAIAATATTTATVTTAKKSSQSSVPSMSSTNATNYSNFLTNSLALQSLAMPYPTQTDVSYSVASSTGIPYRPDLSMMAAAASLPAQPLSMDLMTRIALANSPFTSTATHPVYSKSTSSPKKSTTLTSSYPLQRSTTPVSSAVTSSSLKKSADAVVTSKFNDMFKIDSLIGTAQKAKKEHHMLNHISQYNKHYSHKTEKRKAHEKKDDNNVPNKNSPVNHSNGTSSCSSSNVNSNKSTSPGAVNLSSSGGNMAAEPSKKSGARDQVLDLSPNKIVLAKCDKPDRTEVAVSMAISSSVTAKDHNYWATASVKEEIKEETVHDVQSQPRLLFPSPESNSTSKTTLISRKQRILQESVKNMAQEVPGRLKSPASADMSAIVQQIANSHPTSNESSSKKSESHLISNIVAAKMEEKFSFSKDENRLSKLNSEEKRNRLEETASATDLLSKIINDTLQSDSTLLLPQFNSSFEKTNIDPEIRAEERVISPADFVLRPSSRDSHSSVSSLNAERKTPNSETADIIQDLVTLNQIGGHSIPRRMDYQDSKKHNDINFSNGSMMSQSSLHPSDKNKSSSLPRMNISGFQNEFFKHVGSKMSSDDNSSYNINSNSQDNCFTSEFPSLEVNRLPSLNLMNNGVNEGKPTVFNYQQSVIMPPASARWYTPESKS